MVPWAHPIPYPKWHLVQMSRFCRDHDRDISTNHATLSVIIGYVYVHSTAMWPKK